MAAEPEELRLLTFNMGLLKIRLMGMPVVETPPHVDDRFKAMLAAIPAAVVKHNVDVLALQEIYDDDQLSRLMAVLPMLPYVARIANHRFWQSHNGLAYLTKWPVSDVRILKHRQASALEAAFACKSCLHVTLNDTPLGKLSLANLHTTAGGGMDPEAGSVDRVRQSELQEAINISLEASRAGYAPLIVGDFNCGPECSCENYDFMRSQGFDDVVLPHAKSVGCTWDPTSPLNNLPVSSARPMHG